MIIKPIALITAVIGLSLILFEGQASAQVDPSAALLLRSSGRAPEKQNLDSSRYRVRPGSTNRVSPDSRPPQSSTQPVNDVQTSATSEKAKDSKGNEGKDATNAAADQKDPQIIIDPRENAIRQQVEDRDIRKNIVDLHIAPIYVYNDSISNFWFRNFSQHAPGFSVGADIWFTPEFGVNTTYMTTTGSSIDGSFTDDGRVSTENDWFSGELKFRKAFSNSLNSSMLTLALGYSEYEMKVSSLADERVGTRSSGVHVKAEVSLPSSPSYHWTLGAEFMPRLSHEEVKAETDIQSGDDNESSMLGVHIGGRFLLSREHQMFWKVSHRVERNLFSGQTNINDPRGQSPAQVTGVETTNTLTIFSLGYTWGQ
ncbi:MAG: hypothetical protein AAF202_09005 [Pseudomonadota bacterium]